MSSPPSSSQSSYIYLLTKYLHEHQLHGSPVFTPLEAEPEPSATVSVTTEGIAESVQTVRSVDKSGEGEPQSPPAGTLAEIQAEHAVGTERGGATGSGTGTMMAATTGGGKSRYLVECVVQDDCVAVGQGDTFRQAEEDAARRALDKIKRKPDLMTEDAADRPRPGETWH